MSETSQEYTVIEKVVQPGFTRYRIAAGSTPLTYADVLMRWEHDTGFRTLFNTILQRSPYNAYRWETPAYSAKLADREFEFVLVDYPSFATRKTDSRPYREYFTQGDDSNHGIIAFPSLGGDSLLIAPSPITAVDAYGHLAAFVRLAPVDQVDSLWQVVARAMVEKAGEKPIWLSTAGGGVAWLHVRIDPFPKYYAYAPYRQSHLS